MQHLGSIRVDAVAHAKLVEPLEDRRELRHAANRAGAKVGGWADLERDLAIGQLGQQSIVLSRLHAVADARGFQLLQDFPDLLDRAFLAGMHGDAESGSTGLGESALEGGGPAERRHVRSGQVDAHDAVCAVLDGLLHDGVVGLGIQAAVGAEDDARMDVRILEQGTIHAVRRGHDDMVQVALAVPVALHRAVTQLDQVDVAMPIAAADDRFDAGLHGLGTGLNQLGPVEEIQVRLERLDVRGIGGHQLGEIPVVLAGQLDTLVVGDAEQQCRVDRGAHVRVQLGQHRSRMAPGGLSIHHSRPPGSSADSTSPIRRRAASTRKVRRAVDSFGRSRSR